MNEHAHAKSTTTKIAVIGIEYDAAQQSGRCLSSSGQFFSS